MAWPFCSFCEREREGGAAGPTPGIYIFPDCIRLAARLLHDEPTDGSPENPTLGA